MKAIITYLFCLLSVFVILSCGKLDYNKAARVSCDADRIGLLLKDVMSKRFLYRDIRAPEDMHEPHKTILFLENLSSRESFYYWKLQKGISPDSMKVIVVKDKIADKENTSSVYIGLKETNWDTTDVVLDIDTGQNNIALIWSTYHYKFDHEKCIWKVMDSVYNEY